MDYQIRILRETIVRYEKEKKIYEESLNDVYDKICNFKIVLLRTEQSDHRRHTQLLLLQQIAKNIKTCLEENSTDIVHVRNRIMSIICENLKGDQTF